MSADLDLTDLGKAIEAVLPPDVTYALIVIHKRVPGDKVNRCQFFSPLPPRQAWLQVRGFVEATKGNPLFNPGGK